MGFVGVSHDVQIPGDELFFSAVHLHGGPAPVLETAFAQASELVLEDP